MGLAVGNIKDKGAFAAPIGPAGTDAALQVFLGKTVKGWQ